MSQRHYAYATVMGVPIYNMKNLWEPSREYQGKPVQTPNYLAGFLVPRTQQFWHQEPAFADVVRAAQELCGKYGMTPNDLEWPFRDGNVPEPGKNPIEYMKNHWVFTGSSSSPINVEVVRGAETVKLLGRNLMAGPNGAPVSAGINVKPGDLVVASIALAVSQQNSRKAKIYCNSVLFASGGEEIAVGNTATGAELMEKAKAQGLNITGFQPAGNAAGFGGGFAAPQAAQPGGFGAPQGGAGSFGGAPQGGGFGAPQQGPAAGGFGAQGPAPGGFAGQNAPGQGPAAFGSPQGNVAPGGFVAPAPAQPVQAGAPQGGFGGAPQGFGAPAGNDPGPWTSAGAPPQGGGFAPPQSGGFAPPQGGGFGGPR